VGTNEEYDPETDTWTKKASMPTPRSDFGIAVYENKIYCIGGNTGGVNEVYDPETDTWKTKAPMLSPTTFQSAEANVVNGKIYLIRDGTVHEVYDPAKDKWATRALMPLRTVGVYASAVFDNKIYILGDLYNSTNDYDYLGTEIYDPETDNWSAGAPLPSSDVFWGAGVTTGEMAPERIYVFNQFDGTTRVYNPVDNSWEAAAAMPTSRIAFGVAVVNDMFYLIGGFIQSYFYSLPLGVTRYATNEQYTPFGYGKALPKISVVSPENMTYNATDVTLDFTLNKPAVWIGLLVYFKKRKR
jgi:N-acetylneuraminic acid mutarotase